MKGKFAWLVSAAISIGALIGILSGLSNSPIVGAVIAAIVPILTIVKSFTIPKNIENSEFPPELMLTRSSILVFLFSISMVSFCITGIWIRTHQILSPSPKELFDYWGTINLTDEQKAILVIQQKTGILLSPDVRQGTETPALLGNLYNSSSELKARVNPDINLHPNLNNLLEDYKRLGPPWGDISEVISSLSLPEADKRKILTLVFKISTGGIK